MSGSDMNKNLSPKAPRYDAYLLRFWNEFSSEPQTGFRLRLIDLRTGYQWNFSTLEKLFDFLEQKAPSESCQRDEI